MWNCFQKYVKQNTNNQIRPHSKNIDHYKLCQYNMQKFNLSSASTKYHLSISFHLSNLGNGCHSLSSFCSSSQPHLPSLSQGSQGVPWPHLMPLLWKVQGVPHCLPQAGRKKERHSHWKLNHLNCHLFIWRTGILFLNSAILSYSPDPSYPDNDWSRKAKAMLRSLLPFHAFSIIQVITPTFSRHPGAVQMYSLTGFLRGVLSGVRQQFCRTSCTQLSSERFLNWWMYCAFSFSWNPDTFNNSL